MKRSLCLTSLLLVFIVTSVLIAGCGGNSGGAMTNADATNATAVTPTLLLHYTFDSVDSSSSTTVDDISGNAYNATLVNSAVINNSDYKVGSGSLDLTANNNDASTASYLTLPTFTLTNDFTISCWVKRTYQNSAWPRLWVIVSSAGVGSEFTPVDSSGNCDLIVRPWATGWITSAATLFPLDTWVHLIYVVSYSDQTEYVYINGTKQSITSTFIPVVMGSMDSGNNRIGCINSGDEDFAGLVDDFRVYGGALTTKQAKKLYNGTL